MNELIKQEENLGNLIFEVRGYEVMLDSDLAKLYKCANGTKDINKAVKRHIDKFPEDFMFQLTEEEYKNCPRFQTGTLNRSGNNRGNNIKYLPYVFTEHGIITLSGILKSKIADEMSIKVARAFVSMRDFIMKNKDIYQSLSNINNKLVEYDNNFEYLFKKIDTKENIYLEGTYYDSYSDLIDIVNSTKKELIIIDSYSDKTVLDLIRNIHTNIILITSSKSKLSDIEIEKYNKQYHNLKVIYDNTFHDRYIIIDKIDVYHIGTSINYLGNKTFNINRLVDNIVKDTLIDKINNFQK